MFDQFGDASFDILRDFGERGRAVRPRELQTVIGCGIVTRGDVDCALNFAAANFKRNGGSGSFAAEEHRAAVVD